MIEDIFFILASGSPRRKDFMALLGYPFVVIPPSTLSSEEDVDETPLPNEKPSDLVQRLSQMKARAVALQLHNVPSERLNNKPHNRAVVIAADTIVAQKHKILGKPKDEAEARLMLKALRQEPHQVYSGLTIAVSAYLAHQLNIHSPKSLLLTTKLHRSTVQMRPYTDEEIEAYIVSKDPLDKAGAYGIQNQSFAPVAHLDGCFASVMGFPVNELALALQEINLPLPDMSPICTQFIDQVCCQQ